MFEAVEIGIQKRLFTANMSHIVFASVKTMGNFRSDTSPYVKSCTRTRLNSNKQQRQMALLWSSS